MPIPKGNIRGLHDIRTHSETVDQPFQPYRAYMKIGCLEMEKARRNIERENALHRVNIIEKRFRAIERAIVAEKAALLSNIEQQSCNAPSADIKKGEPIKASPPKRGGFKIRY